MHAAKNVFICCSICVMDPFPYQLDQFFVYTTFFVFAWRKVWGPFNICVHVSRFGGIIHDLWWCVFFGFAEKHAKPSKRLGARKKLSKTKGSSLMLPMLFRRASIFDHTSYYYIVYVCCSWYFVKYLFIFMCISTCFEDVLGIFLDDWSDHTDLPAWCTVALSPQTPRLRKRPSLLSQNSIASQAAGIVG